MWILFIKEVEAYFVDTLFVNMFAYLCKLIYKYSFVIKVSNFTEIINFIPAHILFVIAGLGFALVMGSVLLGGGLEILRKKDIAKNGPLEQEVAGVIYNASHLSVFWQIPQYMFMGASEVFAACTGNKVYLTNIGIR